MKEIAPDDRQKIVDLSYGSWQACANAMRINETRSEDYKAVSRLQPKALAFGQRMAVPDDHRMRFGGPGLMSRFDGDGSSPTPSAKPPRTER